MTHRKGRGQGSGTDRWISEIDCPSCGCPNRPRDRRCMYCREELHAGSASFRIALSPYITNLRKFFNPVPDSKSGSPIWKIALSVLLSSALLAIGVTFIMKGMHQPGYFNWMVAALLVIYGVAALRNAYISTHK